jgi:ribokinase
LTPNEIEARDIFNIPDNIKVSEYGDFLGKIVKNNVIITLGDKGCLYVKPNYYRYFEPVKVDAVDTTGAGDVFNAALTTMLKNNSVEEAIEFAVKASALSVCKPYVMNSIPTKKEVDEYKK